MVGGGDTSIDVASVARRLGHIHRSNAHDAASANPENWAIPRMTSPARWSAKAFPAVLTSLFPIEKMTAAEREREDAKREGIDIQGSVMPLEVLKDSEGKAIGLRMCQCVMKGNSPQPVEGTEYVLECDMIISAIGQMADLSEGLEKLDGGRGGIAVDSVYKVRNMDKHFAGGDAIRPHLLTTAIGHGRIAAETIHHFLSGALEDKRPEVDVHQFNLLEELHMRGLDPAPYDHTQTRGTSAAKFAIHNYEDRGATQIIPHTALFKGHFTYVARSTRDERHVDAAHVLGDFEERIVGFSEEQARKEGERCMSCGMCFECDNCVIYCPQTAVAARAEKGPCNRTLCLH